MKPCPPNWPGTIPEGSILATDIALGDHIVFCRKVWDSSKSRWRDDVWQKIIATVTEVSGDRVILWAAYARYKPTIQQIADGQAIRELWADEEERKPFAKLIPWEPDCRVPEELWHAIAHHDSYEQRLEKHGESK